MGQCKTHPNQPQPQLNGLSSQPYKRQSNHVSFLNRHKNHPNQDFATQISQFPQLTKLVQATLKKLGPFKYQYCGKFTSGVQLGPYKLKNGAIYQGQWHNGKTHGKGKYYLPDNSLFEGISVQNQIQGYGRIIHQNGDYFEGQLKQGRANGIGIYVQGDITYKGSFKDNLQHGQGTQYSQLYQFKGTFKDGCKQKGMLVLKNRDKFQYNGQFKANKFHGYGTLLNDVGKYQGQFINGIKNGFGKFTWADGSYYEGQYRNDQKHGRGKLFDKNGKLIRQGNWIRNHIQN